MKSEIDRLAEVYGEALRREENATNKYNEVAHALREAHVAHTAAVNARCAARDALTGEVRNRAGLPPVPNEGPPDSVGIALDRMTKQWPAAVPTAEIARAFDLPAWALKGGNR